MENAILVHVIYRFNDLVHVEAHSGLGQVVTASFNRLIHIHVHEFEHECQPASRFIIEHLVQCDDIRVRTQSFKRLYFPKIIYLKKNKQQVTHICEVW